MAVSPPATPVAPNGEIIGRSTAKIFGFLALNLLALLFGVFLLWAWLTNSVLDASSSPNQVTWWGALMGACLVLVTPLVFYLLIRSLWVRERLNIAADRLQVIEHLGGQDVVVVQIPFENIAEFKYEPAGNQYRIGINLRSLDNPKTFTSSLPFQENEKFSGRHYIVTGGYQMGLRDIADQLEEAFDKWASK